MPTTLKLGGKYLTWEETRKLQQQLQKYILLWPVLALNLCINQNQLFIECTCQQYATDIWLYLIKYTIPFFKTQNIPSRHCVSQSVIHTLMWFKTFKYLCTVLFICIAVSKRIFLLWEETDISEGHFAVVNT